MLFNNKTRIYKIICSALDADNREIAKWEQEIGDISSNHTLVSGVLSGFSITIAVLIISLILQDDLCLSRDPIVILSLGQFIVSFFGYIITGVLFSITVEKYESARYFLFSVSSIVYYFSAILGFSAILPLIRLIEVESLFVGVSVLVLGSLLGGFMASSLSLYDLLKIKASHIFYVFVLSIMSGLLSYTISISFMPRLKLIIVSCSIFIVASLVLASLSFYLEWLDKSGIHRFISTLMLFFSNYILIYIVLFIILYDF